MSLVGEMKQALLSVQVDVDSVRHVLLHHSPCACERIHSLLWF